MTDSTMISKISPESLAPFYSRFSVDKRILLTGHSHQAWPDCSLDGQNEAWEDAAKYVDNKWPLVFKKLDSLRQTYLALLDDNNGYVSIGQNTHDLLVRFLSALPLKNKPQIVTTDGEFHTIRRQLSRLEEESIEVIPVPSYPTENVVSQIIDSLSTKTAAVLVSSVFFQNAQILSGMSELMQACEKNNTELLIDVYHQLNVVPFSVSNSHLESAFIIGGGYKYCQFGEGVGFLRFPKHTQMRPVITGWFADFSHLDEINQKVEYDKTHDRFAGATFDPVSAYRAVAVAEFFQKQNLTPEKLRDISQEQMDFLITCIDNKDFDPTIISRDNSVSLTNIAGFLALKTPYAKSLADHLYQNNIFSDVRGEYIRLGPAPYVTFEQINSAVDCIAEFVHSKI